MKHHKDRLDQQDCRVDQAHLGPTEFLVQLAHPVNLEPMESTVSVPLELVSSC